MFSPELLDLFNLWVEGLSNSPIGSLQDFDYTLCHGLSGDIIDCLIDFDIDAAQDKIKNF